MGPRIRATAATMRLKRRGSESMERKLRPVPSPVVARARRFALPRAADAAIIRAADERRPARRYLGATVRPSRAQLIDLAIALPIFLLGVGEALARDNTGRWLTAAAVNGAALAFRRRSPLIALVAVVAVQGLAHDATYDTDPLSPFLAELILMFTVAYQLRAAAGAARLRDRRHLRGDRLQLGPHRGDRAGRRAGRLLPARVGDRTDRARAGGRARGGRAPRRAGGDGARGAGPQPRSSRSARGSRASCTTPSPTACR